MQADISKLETEGRNPAETSSAPASNYLSAYLYDILYMSNIYLYDITCSAHHEHNSTGSWPCIDDITQLVVSQQTGTRVAIYFS
jgi:hypothetical protein